MKIPQIIQDQVNAYNAGDSRAFSNCYCDNAVITFYEGTRVRLILKGRSSIEAHYEKAFKESPNLKCEVIHVTTEGEWTQVTERIRNHVRSMDESFDVTLEYRVEHGLISRVSIRTKG